MKTFAALLTAVTLIQINAKAACLGEAQLNSDVGRLVKTQKSCLAFPDVNSVHFFRESIICPLYLEDILNVGIDIGLDENGECLLRRGDQLSGVAVLKADGSIILEH